MTDNQLEKKLKAVAKLKGVSIRQLCIKIGMTENGLSTALKRATIKFSVLVDIAKTLEISPYFFIDRIGKKLTDVQIQTMAEFAVKHKDSYPMIREKDGLHSLSSAILFYEKNAALINAQDFLLDLVLAVKSDENSIPLIIEKYKKKIELSK